MTGLALMFGEIAAGLRVLDDIFGFQTVADVQIKVCAAAAMTEFGWQLERIDQEFLTFRVNGSYQLHRRLLQVVRNLRDCCEMSRTVARSRRHFPALANPAGSCSFSLACSRNACIARTGRRR